MGCCKSTRQEELPSTKVSVAMTIERFANNAQTTLAAAINSGQTSFDVVNASVLPTLSGGDQFRIRIDNEEMIVTGVSGNTLTGVTRGAEGTTGALHNIGATVTHNLTAGSLANVISALSYEQAFLTGDVTLTSAGTFYDGPSISCVAGTWLVSGSVIVLNSSSGGNATAVAKLWDGTTAYKAGEQTHTVDNASITFSFAAVVVLGSTTTLKISVTHHTTSGTAGKILATPLNDNTGLTNKASSITAVRIA